MVDELRNGPRVESALTYAVSAGAGVNILAIGVGHESHQSFANIYCSIAWLGAYLLVGIAAVVGLCTAMTRSGSLSIILYRSSLGLSAAAVVLFARGAIGAIGAS